MNYLRKFESFSEDSRGELVMPITYDKFEILLNNEIEEISNNDIYKIKELVFNQNTPFSTTKCRRYGSDLIYSALIFDIDYEKLNKSYIIFYKFEDGWWLVEMITNSLSDKNRKIRCWLLDSFDGIEKWCDTILKHICKSNSETLTT